MPTAAISSAAFPLMVTGNPEPDPKAPNDVFTASMMPVGLLSSKKVIVAINAMPSAMARILEKSFLWRVPFKTLSDAVEPFSSSGDLLV